MGRTVKMKLIGILAILLLQKTDVDCVKCSNVKTTCGTLICKVVNDQADATNDIATCAVETKPALTKAACFIPCDEDTKDWSETATSATTDAYKLCVGKYEEYLIKEHIEKQQLSAHDCNETCFYKEWKDKEAVKWNNVVKAYNKLNPQKCDVVVAEAKEHLLDNMAVNICNTSCLYAFDRAEKLSWNDYIKVYAEKEENKLICKALSDKASKTAVADKLKTITVQECTPRCLNKTVWSPEELKEWNKEVVKTCNSTGAGGGPGGTPTPCKPCAEDGAFSPMQSNRSIVSMLLLSIITQRLLS